MDPARAALPVPAPALIERPTDAAQRRRILAACFAMLVGGAVLWPWAGVQLGPMPLVAGLFGFTVATVELITFFLLAVQWSTGGSPALLMLCQAYLYSGLMALLHALTFPGAVLPTQPVLGTGETVAWLFMAWQMGFLLMLALAVALDARPAAAAPLAAAPTGRARRLVRTSLLCASAVAAIFAAARLLPLPPYFDGSRFGRYGVAATITVVSLSAVLMVVLWARRRERSALFIWLSLVLVANATGQALAVFGGTRFTVGWYSARFSFAVAATVILALLLVEVLRVQRALSRAVIDLARQAESLQTEIHRREATERMLLQAQKMEAVGQLAGGIAHDFNNLLQVVGMRVELIRRRAPPDARHDDIAVIHRTLRRAEALTRQLLSFSGRRALAPARIRLSEWMPPALELMRALVRDDVVIEAAIAADVPDAYVDRGELESALLNLVSNARDAMPGGGRIRITAQRAPARDGDGDTAGQPWLRLAVRDDGQGMSSEVSDRAFEPFFTTKSAGRGSGLGLSQVYGFVRRSGGEVAIRSAPGAGTQVTLTLPAAPADAGLAASTRPGPVGDASEGRGTRVLVVDDNEDLAQSTAGLLEQFGFAVRQASSGADALAAVADPATRPRLVLSDIVMPGAIDGIALARQLRQRYPDVAIVLSTGFSAAAQSAVQEGFTLLPKPYPVEALRTVLLQALKAH